MLSASAHFVFGKFVKLAAKSAAELDDNDCNENANGIAAECGNSPPRRPVL
jgi:hypothetical protein